MRYVLADNYDGREWTRGGNYHLGFMSNDFVFLYNHHHTLITSIYIIHLSVYTFPLLTRLSLDASNDYQYMFSCADLVPKNYPILAISVR